MSETTGVTVQQRRTPAEIEQVVAQFAGSGLNRTAFCRREHIGLGTLNRYLKRLRQADSGGASDLVAVELADAKAAGAGGSGLAVVLGGGRKIEVGTGFDGGTLERLVRLLERL